MARKKMIFRLWDGNLVETYFSLEEAATRVPEYIEDNPQQAESLKLTAYKSTRNGAKPVFKIEGGQAILEFLADASNPAPIEDELG